MNGPRINSHKEYDVLRKELLDAKKYVLARPIFIATICLAFSKLETGNIFFNAQAIILALFLFNLLFTVDRIKDMAKKVSYIQLIHENKIHDWVGWETSIMLYRNYRKENPAKKEKIKLNQGEYDGYYTTIYYMHISFVLLTIIPSKAWIFEKLDYSFILPLVIFCAFIYLATICHPKIIDNEINENSEIWKKALGLQSNNE